MTTEPTLIIQMQRMGDLIMTFPLIGWLRALEPQRPVWVVAERHFFEGVVALCPEATLFPAEAAHVLGKRQFHRVVNLSHRPEAAALASGIQAAQHLGPVTRPDGAARIEGYWHLYRASLVHNNRHNRFHWADLNALDLVPSTLLQNTSWPTAEPRRDTGRIGLFVGASEAAKRPAPAFWASLARQLVRRGLRPVFLGGNAERDTGREAAALAGLSGSDLCGRFSLIELAAFFQTLDLVVTPDTGPMHLAAWAGTPTLNLSLGPVNGWETAPAPPGHLVLRTTTSCRGCWQCTRGEHLCHARFDPPRIAALVRALCGGSESQSALPRLPGLHLSRTSRDDSGLFDLAPLHEYPLTSRDLVSTFWHHWFHSRPRRIDPAHATLAWQELVLHSPQLATAFASAVARLGSTFSRRLRTGGALEATFWESAPPMLRPLTGFLHLYLQNNDFSPEAWAIALDMLADLASHLRS